MAQVEKRMGRVCGRFWVQVLCGKKLLLYIYIYIYIYIYDEKMWEKIT